MTRPQIGVISDCALQRHNLQTVLSSYGLNVILSCDPNYLEDQPSDRHTAVECWILELQNEALDIPALERLIEKAERPILFGLGKAPDKSNADYISWERRLITKLEEHLGDLELLDSEESILSLGGGEVHFGDDAESHLDEHSDREPAKNIWVLAASLGGPAAVKVFLDQMPGNINAGFLYAQHVDPHFAKVLTQVLGRHSNLSLKTPQPNQHIKQGEVLMVPVDREISFSASGIQFHDKEWPGPYGPSIDQLLLNLHRHYGENCNLIVFSGMGNDGAMAVPAMKRSGCSIWAQTPESCANGAMPQSIIDLECCAYVAEPLALAKKFIEQVGVIEEVQTDKPN